MQQSPSGFAFPAIVQPTGFCLITDKIFTDELRNRNNNQFFLFWGGNAGANAQVNYMTYYQANENLTIHRNINVDDTYKFQSNIINSNGNNNLVLQRNGFDYLTFKSDRIETDKLISVLKRWNTNKIRSC